MPFLILGLILLAVVMTTPLIVQGYVQGKPFNFEACSIGDFGCLLEKSAGKAWLEMKANASVDGVTLVPKGPDSAFRTEEQQESMVATRPGFAAAVGHSPHQLGIAVDVDLTAEGNPLAWLQENASVYGFQPLDGQGATKEPWHWEYHA